MSAEESVSILMTALGGGTLHVLKVEDSLANIENLIQRDLPSGFATLKVLPEDASAGALRQRFALHGFST